MTHRTHRTHTHTHTRTHTQDTRHAHTCTGMQLQVAVCHGCCTCLPRVAAPHLLPWSHCARDAVPDLPQPLRDFAHDRATPAWLLARRLFASERILRHQRVLVTHSKQEPVCQIAQCRRVCVLVRVSVSMYVSFSLFLSVCLRATP